MSKSLRNADNSFGAHLTAAAQRRRNEAASQVAELLSERFEILETVIETETHVLYLARDLSRSGPDAQDGSDLVCLKTLSGDAAGDDRQINLFHLEARAAARLSHENIIKTTEAEEVSGIHFCVIEHKPGVESLRDLIKREGWFELDRALDIIKQIADALDYAHGLGVLHLTLQPEKILVEPDGRVLVTGFGIESQKDLLWAHHERSHACAPQYISPEQVQCKQIDQRSDLYSLGIVMFEMLTDRVPFDSPDSISIKLKHLNKLPEPPHMFRPELPRLLCWLVMDLLKKNPDERPDNVGIFETVFQQCRAGSLEAAEAMSGPATISESDSQHADGEQRQFEDDLTPEPSTYIEHETGQDFSNAPMAATDAEEGAVGSRVLPLIISEADTSDDAGTFADMEALSFPDEVYSDEAPPENRAAGTSLHSENYGGPARSFAFESRMMDESAEATNEPRSHRMAWLACILLVAAVCLVWAMRALSTRGGVRVDEQAIATEKNSAARSDGELKPEGLKSEPAKSEAVKSEAIKSDSSKSMELPAGSEVAASARPDKSAVKNEHDKNERETTDKPVKEAVPVATREMPRQVSSPRLVPPTVSVIPSASGAENSAPSAVIQDVSSNTRPAEPPPSIQQPKREEPVAPRMIRRSGDVLQNSAISRVRPSYPEAARSARIAGPVTVEVTVDEEGNVVAARAIAGPDQLRDAAVAAARGWKWMPTRMDRARVKVVGTITLNFQR